MDNELKGYLLLRQAALANHDRNVLVGVQRGSYNIGHLTAAIRNTFMNQISADTSMKNIVGQNRNSNNGDNVHKRSRLNTAWNSNSPLKADTQSPTF